ncbi:MAG: Purine nucleoside phosphorylase [Candidatus Roizmanbacteria bacterium GW2011_GWA2_35_19]|uniref:purine-nucleoside phosphorylase n=2 Tax=Candidatus Roizmaniibacteriota TaxID=1752723 RepID=A0A0G0BPN8_9BACT|nr:MAG: Purine nucleoside phosphorylase [Candidatus Roizmanbacteria bacterium GW2011_GWC2_35_12]KKP71484.1 MAG: Purine nucleoside phosphorylase [Candidatus Roizmanbacteria bacterium GW2011_GWA2_35_19]
MLSTLGFILGSGWGKIISDVNDRKEASFEKIFNKKATVPGHSGKIIEGKIAGRPVIFSSGRFHTYEGYSTHEVTEIVRYLHSRGVKKIVITSAAGGLNENYKVGDLVILKDVISLFCSSPLTGPKFLDLSRPFSEDMVKKAQKIAKDQKINYQNGTYVYVRGPHYETFPDKKALKILGADVVGMSTVPEVIMANYLKMEVLGLSMVTNLAFVKHDHHEVLTNAKKQEEKLYKFFEFFIKSI